MVNITTLQRLDMDTVLETDYAYGLERINKIIGISSWLCINQDKINSFAENTKDKQWIHVNIEKAKKHSPFKKTVAHGFLTLSLASYFANESLDGTESPVAKVNYGFNRLRFVTPVPVGSIVRGQFKLLQINRKTDHTLLKTYELKIEIKDNQKPALVGEWLILSQY